MINGITLGIMTLNSIWLYLIIKKMNKQINFYKLRKYGIVSIDKNKKC